MASLPRSDDVEHFVIDAGSTDGTLQRLRGLSHIVLVEKPGMPLYQAWNLAVERAAGDAFLFLNGDDWLCKGAIDAILAEIWEAPDCEIIQARANAFGDVRIGARRGKMLVYPSPGLSLDLLHLSIGAPTINAKVIRRSLFDRLGDFDPHFEHAADREFLLRVALAPNPPTCRSVDKIIYSYRIHEGSMTLSQLPRRRVSTAQQHQEIADKFLSYPRLDPLARRYLKAWRAREVVVEAVSQWRAEGLTATLEPAFEAFKRLPGLVVDLDRARRFRQIFVKSCAVSNECCPKVGA